MSKTQQAKGVWLHRRAEMALDAFTPEERRNVEVALGLLGDPAARQFIDANAARLPDEEPLYAMRATPDIRVFFDEDPNGRVRIMDIVREDKLRSFQRLGGREAQPAAELTKMATPGPRRRRKLAPES